jgi:hypothetical protein
LVLLVLAGAGVAANLSHPSPTLPDVGCYLSFYEGELVEDVAGPAIVLPGGHHQLVRWPSSWTLRHEGGGISVYDRTGHFTVRTGTRVHLPGGTAPDGVWESCSGSVELQALGAASRDAEPEPAADPARPFEDCDRPLRAGAGQSIREIGAAGSSPDDRDVQRRPAVHATSRSPKDLAGRLQRATIEAFHRATRRGRSSVPALGPRRAAGDQR